MQKIAILASGSGSNAEKLIEQFQSHPSARVTLVLTNNPAAGVLARAARLGVPTRTFTRAEFTQPDGVLAQLRSEGIDWLVLAGFLWLVPPVLVRAFPRRIVNIHPALLPRFGGRGMYGMHVHEAVVAAGETETGITIHYVNEQYDEGQVIFQARCPVLPTDTPADVARLVQQLEHQHFARVLEDLIVGGAVSGHPAS